MAGVGGVPLFDQRGNPFARIAGKAIDIGAIESLPTPPPLLGDYNQDAVVDAADFTVWRNSLNSHVAVYSGADGNGNGIIDSADCDVWKAHFGETLPSLNVGEASTAESIASLAPIDPLPVVAANGTPARMSRGPALAPSDAVFSRLGNRTRQSIVRSEDLAPTRCRRHCDFRLAAAQSSVECGARISR